MKRRNNFGLGYPKVNRREVVDKHGYIDYRNPETRQYLEDELLQAKRNRMRDNLSNKNMLKIFNKQQFRSKYRIVRWLNSFCFIRIESIQNRMKASR